MWGWVLFVSLIGLYLGLLAWARRRDGRLPGGFELNGPFLMWRTHFGKPALQRIAKADRFWNVVADVGIVATWVMGAAIFLLLLYQLAPYFTAPEVVADSAPSPRLLIGLPGVNPLIPVGYGLVALVLALVIHEGSHGVMAYAAKMRVKSLGVLLFVIPVGAFVEPEEEDMERATTRQKNRVFAAGPTSNLVLAVVAGILLSTVFLGNVAVVNGGEGIGVMSVVEGSGAEAAGLREGDVLVAVAGERLRDAAHYADVMNATKAGDVVALEVLRADGSTWRTQAQLSDKWAYIERVAPDQNEPENQGKGFLGISPLALTFVDRVHGILREPFGSGFPQAFSPGSVTSAPGSFIFYISYPFVVFITGVDVLAAPYQGFVEVTGPLAGLPPVVFFGAATLLYWIVWVNIMLGTFNALPMGPLDGGQMFRATLRERLMRRFRVDRAQVEVERLEMGGLQMKGRDPATQAKLDRIQHITRRATAGLGFFILGLVALPLIGPRVLQLFL